MKKNDFFWNGKEFKSKEECRKRIWDYMLKEKIAKFPLPPHGRIPNFYGSEKACEKIFNINEFYSSKCFFSAPDSVLKKLREIVLINNKILIIAMPHIRGFYELSNIPKNLIREAITIRGFEKFGKEIGKDRKIDIFAQGAVAIDLNGNRIGKGTGYGDKEYHILKERGLVYEKTINICIVHDVQIFNDLSHLMSEKDVKVNIILTPSRIIKIS
jgi:5-formyltetrahydrofolate cyclo-ligase